MQSMQRESKGEIFDICIEMKYESSRLVSTKKVFYFFHGSLHLPNIQRNLEIIYFPLILGQVFDSLINLFHLNKH